MGGSSAKSLLNYFMFAFFFLLYSMIPASKSTPPRRRIAAHRVLFCTTSPVLTLDADFMLEPDPRLDVPLFRLEEPLPSEEEPSLLLPRELLPRVLFPSELFPIEELLLLFPLELLLLLSFLSKSGSSDMFRYRYSFRLWTQSALVQEHSQYT